MTASDGCNWLKELAEKMRQDLVNDAAPSVEKPTVRQFLGQFGFYRRSRYNLSWMRECLEKHGLHTNPDFEVAWIDGLITIELDADETNGAEDNELPIDPTIRVTVIDAAHKRPHVLPPEAKLTKAVTLMRMEGVDFILVSPDASSDRGPRSVKGVVTWRSISLKSYADPNEIRLNQAMDTNRPEIAIDAPLFRAMEPIARYGYVLVRDFDQTITGIVTANDFALQFDQLARPFLTIGEIEGYLRKLIRRKFRPDELNAALPESLASDQVGPGDLTFGGYVWLLQQEANWNRLDLQYVDHGEFIRHVDWLRQKRNEIMHFNPDGLEPEDFHEIERLAEFFRSLNQ